MLDAQDYLKWMLTRARPEVTQRERFVRLILYIGQTPIRSGRMGCILFKCDTDAYLRHGKPITGWRYLKSYEPGATHPGGVLDGLLSGRRWGSVGYRLTVGRLTLADAEWIADQWRDGVPV